MNDREALREKTRRDYELLPEFLKRAVDKRCPLVEEFEDAEQEIAWLKWRDSCQSSLWAGMYCGAALLVCGAAAIVVELVQVMWR